MDDEDIPIPDPNVIVPTKSHEINESYKKKKKTKKSKKTKGEMTDQELEDIKYMDNRCCCLFR